MTDLRAFLSRDRTLVLMTTGRWSQRVPVDEIERWRKLYHRLRERGSKKPGHPGPHAKHYEQPCQVLDALCRQIKEGA